MKQHYADIIDKLGPPLWWDDNGTPRYKEFHPNLIPNIYAREVVYFEIQCQACRACFKVTECGSVLSDKQLLEAVKDHRIHYGDPPNTGCCVAGPTMNSEPLRVLQFWQRYQISEGWVEVEELRNHPLE